MRYRMFESRGMWFVSVYDGTAWMTFTFLDPESQRNFVVALCGVADQVEEVEND